VPAGQLPSDFLEPKNYKRQTRALQPGNGGRAKMRRDVDEFSRGPSFGSTLQVREPFSRVAYFAQDGCCLRAIYIN